MNINSIKFMRVFPDFATIEYLEYQSAAEEDGFYWSLGDALENIADYSKAISSTPEEQSYIIREANALLLSIVSPNVSFEDYEEEFAKAKIAYEQTN